MFLQLLIKQIKDVIDKEESNGTSNEYLNKLVEKQFVEFEKVLAFLLDDTYKNDWRCLLYTNIYGYDYPTCKFDNPEQARKTAQEYYLSMYNDIVDGYDIKKQYFDAINALEISTSDNSYLIAIPTYKTLKTILDNGCDVISFNDRRFDIEFKVSKQFLKDLALKYKTLTFYYNKDGTLSYVDKKTYKTITFKNEVL